MTIKQLCEKTDLKCVAGEAFLDKQVSGVYACDLLSWVIGRAEKDNALVTVMTNVNVIAVAVMADLSCVILTEGVKLDETAIAKAAENEIVVLSCQKTTFETCRMLADVL